MTAPTLFSAEETAAILAMPESTFSVWSSGYAHGLLQGRRDAELSEEARAEYAARKFLAATELRDLRIGDRLAASIDRANARRKAGWNRD